MMGNGSVRHLDPVEGIFSHGIWLFVDNNLLFFFINCRHTMLHRIFIITTTCPHKSTNAAPCYGETRELGIIDY